MARERRTLPMLFLATATAVAAASLTGGGCSTSTQPTTKPASWTEQAKNDPFNYNPSATDEWPSVSGGGISHFDKDAFNKDMDHVLNP